LALFFVPGFEFGLLFLEATFLFSYTYI
jgi:hypothetical protein